MTPTLAEIWRHPVKSVGAEPLERVTLEAGRAMPHDRLWAVAHGATGWNPEAPGWAEPGNFLRVTHVPGLARVTARYDEDGGTLWLTHPDRPDVNLNPASGDGARVLTEWLAPLAEGRRPGPYRLAHAPGGAMTDVPDPWVSVLSLASLRALGQHLGRALDPRRFRGNLWIDGLAPWQEEEWPGREIAIGPVRLEVVEPIGRCRATEAGPESGEYDAPTLDALRATRGHTQFGLYARVLSGGEISRGDPVEAP